MTATAAVGCPVPSPHILGTDQHDTPAHQAGVLPTQDEPEKEIMSWAHDAAVPTGPREGR